MAETAELLQSNYIPIDAFPELAHARLVGRREAYEILEANRQNLIDGNFEAVSIPVDAIGTARRVVQAENIYGRNSLVRQERFGGLVLDCNRLFAEAVRVNTYEYFPPLTLTYDEESEEYHSHGLAVMEMTQAGLSPVAKPEEVDRRINERVEEVTYKTIKRLGNILLAQSVETQPVKLRTISQCADWAIDEYNKMEKDKPRVGFGGYAPQTKKLMIRDTLIDPKSNDRAEEQMGLSGVYITHEVISEALKRQGLRQEIATKTELQGAQLKVDDDMLDFVMLLDSVASEHSGLNIYLGEVLPAGKQKDYEHVREEAIERQQALNDLAYGLAEFVIGLERDGTDRWAAVGIVEAEVKRVLIDMADQDNTLAYDMFDYQTERGLQEVAYLRSIGQFDAAQLRLDQVAEQAPSPGYCGAGSCGLEEIRQGSKEAKALEEMGLNPSNSLIDKKRVCRKCNAKKVAYALNDKKKACLDCKARADLR